MARLLDLPLIVILMGIGAGAMYVPAAHALAVGNLHVARVFLYSGTFFLFLIAMIAIAVNGRQPQDAARSHLLALLLAFTLLPLMLAVPFAEALRTTSYTNAWFEMVSSFTTTGATLYDQPGRLAPSLHLWRGLVGWLGGFFVLVTAVAILAPMNLGGFEVMSAAPVGSSSGQGIEGADPARRLRHQVAVTAPVYGGLTLLLWIGLIAAGDAPLTGLIHAMSTLSTSGISPTGGMTGAGAGRMGEVLIFLFLFFAISRRTMPVAIGTVQRFNLWADPEFRIGVVTVATLPVALFALHWWEAFRIGDLPGPSQMGTTLWGNAFTVLSFLTTTGFVSSDWGGAVSWSGLRTPGLVLVGLALVGGGVATTAGGVKILRIYALYLQGLREIEKIVHPHSVGGQGPVRRHLRSDGAFIAWIAFMLVAMSIAAVVAFLALTGLDFETSLMFAISCLTTTGPLAQVAADTPLSYTALDTPAKIVLGGAMVLGRMETLAIIALLAPGSWRN